MRADPRYIVGFVLFHLLVAATGGSLLFALGMQRGLSRSHGWRTLELFAFAGPSFFCGVALLAPFVALLLVLGVPVHLGELALVTVLAIVALSVFGARHRPVVAVRSWRLGTGLERKLALGLLAGTALFLALGSLALVNQPTSWDDAHIWSLRGLSLYQFGGLEPAIFQARALASFHQDYPLLQPLLEASLFHALGTSDLRVMHWELWLLNASGLATLAYLMLREGRALVWAPTVVALAVAGGVHPVLELGSADVTMAIFLAVGALSLALWLERGESRHGLLATVLLGAAASTKNEGLAFSGAILVLGIVITLALRRRAALAPLLGMLAIYAVDVAPWRIWLKAHGPFDSEIPPLSDALHWTFLSERWGRVPVAVQKLLSELGSGAWVGAPALLLAAAAVCLAGGMGRRLAAFYLAGAVTMFATLVWVYWTGTQPDVAIYLQNTASRVVASIGLVSAVGAMHLSTVLAGRADQ